MNKNYGFKIWALTGMTTLAVFAGATTAHASSETESKKVETGLFDLSYERNNDWRYQCGYDLTRKVLQLFGAVRKENRQNVLNQIHKIEIVEDRSIFGKESEAELDEETGTLTITFVRDGKADHQRSYCIDSGAVRQTTSLVVALEKEAEEERALQARRAQDSQTQAAEGNALTQLLRGLEGPSRSLAVDPASRQTDQTAPREGNGDSQPVQPPKDATDTQAGSGK